MLLSPVICSIGPHFYLAFAPSIRMGLIELKPMEAVDLILGEFAIPSPRTLLKLATKYDSLKVEN